MKITECIDSTGGEEDFNACTRVIRDMVRASNKPM